MWPWIRAGMGTDMAARFTKTVFVKQAPLPSLAIYIPHTTRDLLKDAELGELGHLLSTNLTYDHDPVTLDMGGDGPVRGRVRWQIRRTRCAQCATALALATLAVLVAVGTLVADGESARTDAGTCSGARADVTATISNIFDGRRDLLVRKLCHMYFVWSST